MAPIVVTTCTHRKRLAAAGEVCGRTLPLARPDRLAAIWCERLRENALPRVSLGDLYCGRGFRESEAAAQQLGAPLFVVSAGLGLAAASAPAPAYNLTLTPGSPDNVLAKMTEGGPAEWWRALVCASDFHTEAFDGGGLLLAALSGPYLGLVRDAWRRWPAERIARLRLFTKDARALPSELQAQVMPYDDRLDALDGFAGTQGDFAQRALRHFASSFAVTVANPREHAHGVRDALAPLAAREIPLRGRLSDEALIDLIRREWDVVGGRSSAMLRRLRSDLNVACEQGRFKVLFRQAAEAREGALL